MPKLSQQKIEERKTVIEDAAKELLIKQGFHATSMRDIARRASISLGNVYNYFETKEAIFESIINRYVTIIDQKLKEILEELDEPLDPKDMRRLGEMVGELVDRHQDFWLLMYIDVLEFQNRHFRKMFEGLAEKFRRLFEEKFASAIERGDLRSGVDPAVGFTVAYMQFFNYFLVERLFGGNLHLGLTDEQALNYLTKIFCYGVLSESKLTQFKKDTIKKVKTAQTTKT
ncbi:MAG: TetR/AcrR family transcriptional regulator [Acidobacteriota bacterium]|jgi:AcrR family transcriptional regulator|nr:TetR/AcrR family transcriptional regulator [Acidobacteriota bacterium]